ncbi:MAG: PAS domain-containing protein, partial [Leptolyngbyaceae cyanobacterium SL_1_1]|nr:PAS domain-containing protein [Leptolyngbyaceae cyanobacterium SL_1_1]
MRIALRHLLVTAFIAQVAGMAASLGYLSYQSGYSAVQDLANQLMAEIGDRTAQKLDDYLQTAKLINQLNAAEIKVNPTDSNNLDRLHRRLIAQHQQITAVTTILFGTPQGDLRTIQRVSSSEAGGAKLSQMDYPLKAGVSSAVAGRQQLDIYEVDAEGNLGQYLSTLDDFDVRDRPWYQDALKTGKAGWSEPSQIGESDVLAINAYQPAYNNQGKLLGVFAVNLSLNSISDFLKILEIGKSGEVFIFDCDRFLIASSVSEMFYSTRLDQAGNTEFERIPAAESNTPLLRDSYQALRSEFGELQRVKNEQQMSFESEGDRYFLQAIPYKNGDEPDWLIVVAVPKADFMAAICASAQRTVWLGGLALLVAIGVGVWLARRITRPVLDLERATHAFASGAAVPLSTSKIREIDSLQQQFGQMTTQLQAALTQLQQNERELEQRVEAQTQELQERERFLSTLVTNLPGFIYRVANDRSYTPEYISEGVFSVTGYLPKEYLAEGTVTCSQIIFADDREAVWQTVQQAVALRQPYECEYRIVAKSGEHKWLWERGRGIFSASGEVLGLEGFATDISDRKRAELALKESESRFQEIANTIHQLFFVRCAMTRRYLYVSPAYERIWGRSIESLNDSPESWQEAIHIDDRERIQASIANQFNGQSTEREYRIVRPNGEVRWIYAQISPVLDEAGQPLRYIGIADDITCRKQAEAELKASRAELELIADSVPGCIAYIDAEQRYCFVNKTYEIWFRQSQKAFLGRTVQSVIGTKAYAQVQTYIERALVGETISYEAQIPYARGGNRHVAARLVPDFDQHSKVVGCYALVTDISDRKRAELELVTAKEAAEAANKAKDIFVANISHELRSPLSAILGFVRLLKDSNISTQEQHSYADIIEQSGDHLLNIVNQLLDLAKVEANKATLDLGVADLSSLLNDLKNLFFLRAQNKQLNLTIQCAPDVPNSICTDNMKLRQVLINLLDNALKFTETGSIELRVCRHPEQPTHNQLRLQFEVSDTGVGMTVKDQVHLFQAFAQAKVRLHPSQGNGLGLVISRRFVQIMGGDIICISELGSGTTFRFDILSEPTQAANLSRQVQEQRVIGLVSAQMRLRLLIVDDN